MTPENITPEPTVNPNQITIEVAHTLRGEGTSILWRPDGKITPDNPDSDIAILNS